MLKASQKGTKTSSTDKKRPNLCVMNMFLHNIPNPKIKWGDVLTNPLHLDANGDLRRFSKIVANPPFSLDKWGYDELKEDRFSRFNYGMLPKSKGKIRAKLVEQGYLKAIIGLANKLFYGTSIPACIMILARSKNEKGKNQNT